MHLSLVNTSEKTVTIEPGDKIVQFILVKTPKAILRNIMPSEYEQYTTDRGEGGFGSTGTK